MVYGNRAYDDTLLELKTRLKRAGFRCAAAVAAVAEHSIMCQFATGRPDPGDLAEYFGFTEQEISALCEKYEMSFEEAKRGTMVIS